MIIGLSGKKRVGKNTCSSYLVLKYGFKEVAFADLLKKFARKMGWDGMKDIRGRKFLQDLGSVVRDYDQNFWVDSAMREVEKQARLGYEHFVIPDVRYLNEVAQIREEGGILMRVWSESQINDDPHPSEVELDKYNDWDFKLQSVLGDFNGYYEQIDDVMDEILSGRWQRGAQAAKANS